jgi:acyl-CoA synthetase (AMP-forming)/AMP-acid ligase II
MRIYRSPWPDMAVTDTAITDHVFAGASRYPDRVALVDGPTGRRYSYAELIDAIARVAGGLAERGFSSGDVLAVMAPNVPEYAIAFHAATRLGGAVTTINPAYGADEAAYQLSDSGARLLVAAASCIGPAREAAARTKVEHIFLIGDGADREADCTPLLDLARSQPHPQVPVDADATAALPYSSGTTGLPKGVMLTHRNLTVNIVQTEIAFPMGEHEVYLAALPFFHVYGMQVIMNMGLHCGATIVTMPRFDLEGYLRLAQEHRMTVGFLVPPIILALAKHPIVDGFDLSSVRAIMSGAAPLGAELAEATSARLGCEVFQGYGMTELSPVSHVTPRGANRPGAVGHPVPSTECRIVDPETGADAPDGADGELWIRGPLVMRGYLNNPEATAQTIDAGGWLHTGDIARVDADGFFTIVDRVKELIKYKGFQVAPAELEALLLSHPEIADAAVIPIPDDEAGEVPKAIIVRSPAAGISADEVMAFVAGHVATYKRVRSVEFVDTIPKSPSGKILRRLLRDREAGRR